jgi:hypothetical protein
MAANLDALVGVSTETSRPQDGFRDPTARARARIVMERTSHDPDLCEMQFWWERTAAASGRQPVGQRPAAGTVEFASGSKSHEGPDTGRPIPLCVSET